MKIALLYGTESGNAEMLCEDIEEALEGTHDCTIANLADVAPADMDAEAFHIIVCATHGNGDMPAGAAAFAARVEAEKPDLSQITFSIFGLGDMVFADTFAQGSEKLMGLLLAQGAQQVGARGIHDASTGDMPEDIALPWVQDCLAQFLDQAA